MLAAQFHATVDSKLAVRSKLEPFRTLWSGLGMAEKCTMNSERVDDMPRLLAHPERMGIQALRDEHVPTHGHWVGCRLGGVTGI
jgi:hypothetical protein